MVQGPNVKQVLFIHRSVGQNLLRDGHVYELIEQAGQPFALSDYNHNNDTLTDSAGKQTKLGFHFPGDNTHPEDFAALFSENVAPEHQPILDMAMGYDVIVLKSCYPNSNIKSDEQLKVVQQAYQSIAEFFGRRPDKQLIILTSPPLIPFLTKPAAASRARQLTNWLAGENLGPNVHVFNFFDLLAAPEGEKQANMLRRSYRRWLPFDSHPNAKASKLIAPQFISYIQGIAS